jgi:hypothetical protein
MRKIYHRLLSAFPMLALAVLALMAAADPDAAKIRLYGFMELTSDARFFWLCIALVVGYFVIWWLTSLEAKSRRQRIQDGLRPHFQEMANAGHALKLAATDDEFHQRLSELDPVLQSSAQWVMDNMGEAAFTKFNRAQSDSLRWTWPGEHAPGLMARRSEAINFQNARIEVLDTFLRSDGWDGPSLGWAARIRRSWKIWTAQ